MRFFGEDTGVLPPARCGWTVVPHSAMKRVAMQIKKQQPRKAVAVMKCMKVQLALRALLSCGLWGMEKKKR